MLDPQVLFDPLEEQLDLPSTFVKCADCKRRQSSLVGQEDQGLACFGILEADAAQMRRVIPLWIIAIERNRLIADDALAAIRFRRIDSVVVHVRLGARDEEAAGQMQNVKSLEIDVGAIHDINRDFPLALISNGSH